MPLNWLYRRLEWHRNLTVFRGWVEIAHFSDKTSVAASRDDYGPVWWGWLGMSHSFSLCFICSGCGGFDADGNTLVVALGVLYRAAH